MWYNGSRQYFCGASVATRRWPSCVGRRSRLRTQYVSLKEAARALGVNYDSLHHHFRAGRIPVAQRVGNVILVEVPVVKAVLDAIGYTPRRKEDAAE